MKSTCDYCHSTPVNRFWEDAIIWCGQCIQENSNLLNSLELSDGFGDPAYREAVNAGQYSWSMKKNLDKFRSFFQGGIRIGE